MKIGHKIICGFVVVIFLFALSTSWVNYQLRQLRLHHEENVILTANALELKNVLISIESTSAALAEAVSGQDTARARQVVEQLRLESAKDLELVTSLARDEHESAWSVEFQTRCGEYLDSVEKQLVPLLAQDAGADQMQSSMALLKRKRDLAAEPLTRLIQTMVGKQKQAGEAYIGILRNITNITGIIFIIDLLASCCIAYILRRSILNPLNRAVAFAQELSRGNLEATIDMKKKDELGVLAEEMRTMTANLKGLVMLAQKISLGDLAVKVRPLSNKDLLGHSLKTMVEKLSSAIAEIRRASDHVSAGAAQMNATSQSLSQGATEQASSLEEITSSMQEISSQTRHNAENASQADQLARETKISAEQGNNQMAEMFTAMRDMKDSGRNISKINKIIDEIAFQTNLLALNAAVEAARAGKYGKGFAVVAEEVRSLAARSAQAAREAAHLVEDSVQKVDTGAELAEKTALALYAILTAAEKMTRLVSDIAAGSNEQAQGVSQITSGLGQVDQITQLTTAHAEQCAAAAEELSGQAALLQQLVSIFKLDADSFPAPDGSFIPGALNPCSRN